MISLKDFSTESMFKPWLSNAQSSGSLKVPDINWGNVINKGFEWAQDALNKKTSGPLAKTPDYNPAPAQSSSTGNNIPAWLLPVAIAVGVLMLLKGKRKK